MLAGIQGGYLLSALNKDVRPMEGALEAILAYLQSFVAPAMGQARGAER